jgi:uncharacterized protein YecT (DUF1311 family)
MKRILTTITICLLTLTAFSQTQQQLNREAAERYQKVDAELNKVYKELMALLSPERKALLVKAQRAWITFRDTHCQYESSIYEGGSMKPLLHAMCKQDLTEHRLKQLEQAKKEAEH